MDQPMDRVWWNQITNAQRFINGAVENALSGKSIVLSLPEEIPWYATLRRRIETGLQNQDASKSFVSIRSPEKEVGRFLLHQYCEGETRSQYRPNLSYAAFLAQTDHMLLNNRYVWVENVPPNLWREWMEFLSEYHTACPKGKRQAVFLLICRDCSLLIPQRRQVAWMNYSRLIHDYDSFTFCSLVASSVTCDSCLRPYLVELVHSLCGNDIELCAACMADGQAFLENPEATLEAIVQTQYRSNEQPFTLPPAVHGRVSPVWAAQIKTIFPLLERYRNYLVEQYAAQIQRNLPIQSLYNEIWEPQEAELGVLFYMTRSGVLPLPLSEYNRLGQFREARNKLAHSKPLSLSLIEELYQFKEK